MLLFRDEEHVDRWCSEWNQPSGATMTIDQTWGLARAWYHDKMDANWRRPNAEEAERLLAELGLTGAFWSLRT
jgi:nitrous oxide reductase accessory protein NosL